MNKQTIIEKLNSGNYRLVTFGGYWILDKLHKGVWVGGPRINMNTVKAVIRVRGCEKFHMTGLIVR